MRIAVIGDSFTEGIGDEWPNGAPRGWADRLVEVLAERLDEPVFYANFAIRGRTLRPIAAEQLDAALALDPKPDLLILNGGGNDMLRPTFSAQRMMTMLERVAERCLEAGVPLVLVTAPKPTEHLPLADIMTSRGDAYMDAARELSSRRGVPLISNWDDAETREFQYWADDRLHLGPLGHARVAAQVLTALGYDTPVPPPGPPSAAPTKESEAAYRREFVLPYVARRLAFRSTGRHVLAKHPTWHQVGTWERAR